MCLVPFWLYKILWKRKQEIHFDTESTRGQSENKKKFDYFS